ncbi:MAG: hypothetical protein GXO97_04380 [Nitrospirae bacterium]|nr:hypothetical protein [Nitrospirota bacterium]
MKKLHLLLLSLVAISLSFSLAFAGVLDGKRLFNDTTLGTNEKSCNSCHPDGSGINGKKQSYTIMGQKLGSVEDAINLCIKMALNGKVLKKDSQKMKDLSSFVKTLTGKKRKRKMIKGC